MSRRKSFGRGEVVRFCPHHAMRTAPSAWRDGEYVDSPTRGWHRVVDGLGVTRDVPSRRICKKVVEP